VAAADGGDNRGNGSGRHGRPPG